MIALIIFSYAGGAALQLSRFLSTIHTLADMSTDWFRLNGSPTYGPWSLSVNR